MQNKNKKQKQEKNKKTITLRYLRLRYRLSDLQTYTHSWREMKKDDEHWGGKEDLPCCEPSYTPLYSRSEMRVCIQTRPDTRQDSRGRLGKGCNAKKCSKLKKIFVSDVPTNMARCRVACPRLQRGYFYWKFAVQPIWTIKRHGLARLFLITDLERRAGIVILWVLVKFYSCVISKHRWDKSSYHKIEAKPIFISPFRVTGCCGDCLKGKQMKTRQREVQ